MSTIIVLGLLFIVVALATIDKYRSNPDKEKTKYHYSKKPAVMTDHELKYFKILNDAVGGQYYILAQAHLSAFLDEKVKGQNWKGAFQHINGKSIDFLLCEHGTLAPVLGIELDDKSHELSARRLRDEEVERIFSDAGLPIMRVESHGEISVEALRQKIRDLVV